MATHIERNNLDKILQENSKSMVEFLEEAVKNPPEFYKKVAKYISKEVSSDLARAPKIFLLHGSPNEQTILKPAIPPVAGNKNGSSALIYATTNPNYAIFVAILDLKEGGRASVFVKDVKTRLGISRGFVNGESRLSNGYVHLVNGNTFNKLENDEYSSSNQVPVILSIPVKPDDLTEPIHVTL